MTKRKYTNEEIATLLKAFRGESQRLYEVQNSVPLFSKEHKIATEKRVNLLQEEVDFMLPSILE